MILSEDVIEQRLQETEVRFNAAKIAKDQAEAQLEDKSNECLRIQGEFRALQDLRQQLAQEVLTADTPKPEVHVKDEPKQEAINGRTK